MQTVVVCIPLQYQIMVMSPFAKVQRRCLELSKTFKPNKADHQPQELRLGSHSTFHSYSFHVRVPPAAFHLLSFSSSLKISDRALEVCSGCCFLKFTLTSETESQEFSVWRYRDNLHTNHHLLSIHPGALLDTSDLSLSAALFYENFHRCK